VVRDLPGGLPKGWPVEVTFEYAANGRLAVEALVPGTQHQARLELLREAGLSNEGLTRWKQPVSQAGGFQAFESAAKDVQRSAPQSPEAAAIATGAAAGWTPAKAETAGPMTAPPPLPTPVPAEPSTHQQWVSSPQPLTGAMPLAPVVPASGPAAAATSTPAMAAEPVLPLIKPAKPAKPEKKRRFPKWLERLIGHTVTLVLFAFVAYLMISYFRPDLLSRHSRSSGQENEQKQADRTP
jgi:hypothetical protein